VGKLGNPGHESHPQGILPLWTAVSHISLTGFSGFDCIYILRFSVLPALSLNDGIIHCDVVEGAFDSELFYIFITRLLDQMEPFPGPKSIIVMDNCRIHKHPDVLELIESR